MCCGAAALLVVLREVMEAEISELAGAERDERSAGDARTSRQPELADHAAAAWGAGLAFMASLLYGRSGPRKRLVLLQEQDRRALEPTAASPVARLCHAAIMIMGIRRTGDVRRHVLLRRSAVTSMAASYEPQARRSP
jgi:hypothetical protein